MKKIKDEIERMNQRIFDEEVEKTEMENYQLNKKLIEALESNQEAKKEMKNMKIKQEEKEVKRKREFAEICSKMKVEQDALKKMH